MADKTLADIASKMGNIDIAILSTKTDNGQIASRPMSNNGDVEYDGDSYYFTYEKTRMVKDIERDPAVALDFTGKGGLLSGDSHFYAAVQGRAQLIRSKNEFKAHWTPDLDVWFDKGVDTPGIVLIKVHAERIKYWDGEDEGQLTL